MATKPICCISECDKPTVGRQVWCNAHYRRKLLYGNPTGGTFRRPKASYGAFCAVDGCAKPPRIFGLCAAHHHRYLRHGDPLGGGTPLGAPLKYIKEIALPYEGDDCLPWPYAKTHKGYGHLVVDGKEWIASRFVCDASNGPPPTPRHEAAHLCGNGHLGCVTPRHLVWKTRSGNHADKLQHGTHSRGERHYAAKITNADAEEIRNLKGKVSRDELAERFHMSASNIWNIQAGKSFKV